MSELEWLVLIILIIVSFILSAKLGKMIAQRNFLVLIDALPEKYIPKDSDEYLVAKRKFFDAAGIKLKGDDKNYE